MMEEDQKWFTIRQIMELTGLNKTSVVRMCKESPWKMEKRQSRSGLINTYYISQREIVDAIKAKDEARTAHSYNLRNLMIERRNNEIRIGYILKNLVGITRKWTENRLNGLASPIATVRLMKYTGRSVYEAMEYLKGRVTPQRSCAIINEVYNVKREVRSYREDVKRFIREGKSIDEIVGVVDCEREYVIDIKSKIKRGVIK